MLWSRDEFSYFQCSRCGCLQISDIPDDTAKYRPSDYYSLQQRPSQGGLRQFARTKRQKYTVFGPGFAGKLLRRRSPDTALEMIGGANPDSAASILDVRYGSGAFVHSLRDLGFRKLCGVDPYVARDMSDCGIIVLKKTLLDLPDSDRFDFIFFNHSFEHILSQQAGLAIKAVVFDSTEFQFCVSEQYRRDIPLTAATSYWVAPRKSIFTAAQIRGFRKKSPELDRINEADQAAFCLTVDTASPQRDMNR